MSKKRKTENYLERIPVRTTGIRWSLDDEGVVTLEIDNKGIFNKLAQVLLKKPKISYIHLDKIGSDVWLLIDENANISRIADALFLKYGDEINPLYERISKYFSILESYGFITWKDC